MNIYPEDLAIPLDDVKVERLMINPSLKPKISYHLEGSYVVQSIKTKLWQAIKVNIDQSCSRRPRIEILKRGRWVKGGHTAIAHAKVFEGLN